MGAVPADFLEKWKSYFINLHTVNIYTLLLAVAAIVIILLWPKVTHKIPGPLIAILLTTAAVQLFRLAVESIGSRFWVNTHKYNP